MSGQEQQDATAVLLNTETTSVLRAATIEHDKPVFARFYEQKGQLNEYLLLHYGEHLTGRFKKAPATDAGDNKYALDITASGSGAGADFGNFGVLNVATGEVEEPPFPTFALNFPARVAAVAAHFAAKEGLPLEHALDVGCAVGRTAFELSRHFTRVAGIDYSSLFIEAAQELAKGVSMDFSVPIEGSVCFTSSVQVQAPQYNPERCTFAVGDATTIAASVEAAGVGAGAGAGVCGQFHVVTAANLIDRLPAPAAFLKGCAAIVAPGGLLVLTSPYTWLAHFTPPAEWLGGGNTSTFTALRALLDADFELLHDSHMPFLIRETGRKSQFSFAHLTVWRRRK